MNSSHSFLGYVAMSSSGARSWVLGVGRIMINKVRSQGRWHTISKISLPPILSKGVPSEWDPDDRAAVLPQ